MTAGMLDAPCTLLHGAIVAVIRHERQTATASFQVQTLLMPSGYFRNATGKMRVGAIAESRSPKLNTSQALSRSTTEHEGNE
jgi:hypothetical protein